MLSLHQCGRITQHVLSCPFELNLCAWPFPATVYKHVLPCLPAPALGSVLARLTQRKQLIQLLVPARSRLGRGRRAPGGLPDCHQQVFITPPSTPSLQGLMRFHQAPGLHHPHACMVCTYDRRKLNWINHVPSLYITHLQALSIFNCEPMSACVCSLWGVTGAKVGWRWRWALCGLRRGQTATVTKVFCLYMCVFFKFRSTEDIRIYFSLIRLLPHMKPL